MVYIYIDNKTELKYSQINCYNHISDVCHHRSNDCGKFNNHWYHSSCILLENRADLYSRKIYGNVQNYNMNFKHEHIGEYIEEQFSLNVQLKSMLIAQEQLLYGTFSL